MTITTVKGVDSKPVLSGPFESTEDATESFLKGWEDEDNESSPSPPEEDTKDPDTSEDEESEEEESEEVESEESEEDPEEETEEAETEEEEESKSTKKVLEDDQLVEVKVDDEVLKVSVKDLKRLYGQEASLTKKSQQLAAKRKEIEQEALKSAVVLDKMYKKAEERWKPYSEVDMLLASKQLDAEQFAALRSEANSAWEDFKFVSEEVDNFLKESQAQQQKKLQEAAVESVKVLKENIPNWSSNLYDSIREYAVVQGMPQTLVNSLVDPVAIQIIHKARLYDEGKKLATKKKVAAPTKVLKTTKSSDPKALSIDKTKASALRLRDSGDLDDAADLFLSRWTAD